MREVRYGRPSQKQADAVISKCVKFQMKKLDELAHLLANPVLPKARHHWSGVGVFIASAPQPDHLRRSFYARDREVLTEHALEVSYFFEVLRDFFYEEALIDHLSKLEFFGRLATAAEASLLEQPDATAHLVCAAVLRETYAMAKQIDKPKNANGGAEHRVVLLRRKHLRINGFSPRRSIAERWD
jgi:hypothetical protein